jgi:hypothetical protein
MKNGLPLLVLWLVSNALFAQNGNFFLSHYTPQQENIDHFSFDIAQNKNGIIYFANKAGVLQFDGRNWMVIPTTGPIYTIAISSSDDQIFVGGLAGFGKLAFMKDGLVYQSLSKDHPKALNIFQSVTTTSNVFFLSHENLFVVDISSNQVTATIPAGEYAYNGIFEIQGEVFLQTEGDELLKWTSGKLTKSQINASAGSLLFSHNAPGLSGSLIGTTNDRIFLYDKNELKEIVLVDTEYLVSNTLVSGVRLNESLIALGTLRGGVLFVDPKTGETKELINYYTGLPDNEVYAMLGDQNSGVWVAHDYGFTRIAPYLPFRSYSHYPGIEGNLLCAFSENEDIYVGTSLGLFKLVRDEIYSEEVYYVTKKSNGPAVTQPEATPDEAAKTSREKARRGLFGRRRKDKVEEKPDPAPTVKTEVPAKVITVKEKRTRKVLKSLQYRYQRVAGIGGKVTNLLKVEDELYAAGLSGVFKIDALNATAVTNDPVRSVFLSPSLNQLIVSTYNEEIKSFRKSGQDWTESHLLDTVKEYVSYMFEDKLQNLWLCSRAFTLKVEMVEGKITNIDRVPYLRPSIDETVGLAVGSDVYVVNAGEFQLYDAANSKFLKYDSLPGTRKYFASAGSFWFHDGHRWRTIDRKLSQAMQLDWLGLFSDIRYLSAADGAKSLWVISASNELYRFSPDLSAEHRDYPLFLREVRGPQSKYMEPQKLSVEEEDGALTFEFIQPDYLGNQSTEYRYLVAGLSDKWSDWSASNNVVPFPYLPSGDYEIRVQSKNLFGKVTEIDKIYFSVLPPYWKRPWFYAMEVAFFSLLVLASIRLSVINPRYKPISQVLSLLTVIIFIELVQTTVYALVSIQSSPVIEFLIQVFIAMLVLPLEERVRAIMQKAAEGRYTRMRAINTKELEVKDSSSE